jgi:hypothetical protein
MHSFVAARIPARALLDARCMIGTADQDGSASDLLEMAFETEVCVSRNKHLGIDASMRVMTCGATFFHRLVLENVRTTLGGMALKASVLA